MKTQTFRLIEKILAFKHGYMCGEKCRKLEIDLTEFVNADEEKVYNYFLEDPLLVIFWQPENNKFLIAKHT